MSMFSVGSALRIFGIVLTAGCVIAGVYLVDWRRTLQVLEAGDPLLILCALVLLVLTFCVFALRWRHLINSGETLPFQRIFDFLMIGYLSNAVLPARPGDIVRAVLLRQLEGISLSFGLASIVLERICDILAICALGIVLSLLVTLPPVVLSALYMLAAAVCAVLGVLLFVSWRRFSVTRLLERFPRLQRQPVARFAAEWLGRFMLAIRALNSPTRLAMIAFLTCLGWCTLALFVMTMIDAFHVAVPKAAAILVLVTTNLGAAIPSSPGAVGVYHLMAILALAVWHVDASTALAFAIGLHALNIGSHVVIGLICTWVEGVRFGGMRRFAEAISAATTSAGGA